MTLTHTYTQSRLHLDHSLSFRHALLNRIDNLVLHTTRIHMQTYLQIQNTGGLCCFIYAQFINFLTSVHGDTRRETQFLKVYANYTIRLHPTHGASCDV